MICFHPVYHFKHGAAGPVSLPADLALYGKDLATFSLPATNVIFNSGYTTGLSKGVLLLQNSGIQKYFVVERIANGGGDPFPFFLRLTPTHPH